MAQGLLHRMRGNTMPMMRGMQETNAPSFQSQFDPYADMFKERPQFTLPPNAGQNLPQQSQNPAPDPGGGGMSIMKLMGK